MSSGVYIRSAKQREDISNSLKGRIFTDEHRKNISLSKAGIKLSDNHREKLSIANRNKKLSEEHKQKLLLSHLGKSSWNKGLKYKISKKKVLSDEHKFNISKTAKKNGFGKWMIGRKPTEVTRNKLSIVHSGENSHLWRGGISKNEYPKVFNQQLRERIRVRDNFICQMCFIPELECKRRLHIHHIDYDKNNCIENNLISLCNSCHGKTNINREHWISLLNKNIIL